MFLKSPAISPKNDKFELFFISDETIWKLTSESLDDVLNGKYHVARHLFFQGAVANLTMSQDGKTLAFSGSIENCWDVYIMPVEGGNPIRCTYLNASILNVTGWKQDDILFTSNHESAHRRDLHAYFTPTQNGESVQLEYDGSVYGNAKKITDSLASWYSENGDYKVIQTDGYGYAVWRGYEGGSVGKLWLSEKNKNYKEIAVTSYNCMNPIVTAEGKVYYLTDKDGCGNVYCYHDGKDRPITDSEDFYIRDFSLQGDKVFYSKAGKIYLWDDKEIDLNIQFKAHKPQLYPRFAHEDDIYTADDLTTLSSLSLNKDGKQLAMTMRGQAFVMKPYVINATKIGDFGYTMVDYLGEKQVLIKTDLQDEIQILDEKGEIEKTLTVDSPIVALHPSPCGEKIAFRNIKHELWLWNMESGDKVLLKPAQSYNSMHLDWSPDGRYIVYSCRVKDGSENAQGLTFIDTTEDNKVISLPIELMDCCPVFDPNGKYLYFLSNRSMRTTYDDVRTQLNFHNAMKPYVMILQKDGEHPFRPWMYEEKKDKATEEKEDDVEKSEEKTEETEKDTKPIDFEGLTNRVFVFPVVGAEYVDLFATTDGVMWMKNIASFETFKKGGKKDSYILEKFDFTTLRPEVIVEAVSSVTLSADRSMMAWIADEHIQIAAAGKKPSDKEIPWKNGGVISWSRISFEIEQQKEFDVIFKQAFTFVKQLFQHQDDRQPDWSALYEKYYPLLKNISCRSELNNIILEMQGELGTSHSYVLNPGDVRALPEITQGYLGGRVKYTPEGYEITEIFDGRVWSDRILEYSPMAQLNIGDKILSINGRKLDKKTTPEMCLKQTSGKFIEVNLISKGSEEVTTTYIRPIPTEANLRYLNWVEKCRAAVSKATNDQVGYMHIPNMDVVGYVQFCRDYYKEYRKKALIIDIRYNGGGYTSPMVLSILTRKLIGSVKTPFETSPEPYESPTGNMVFLCNGSSGSDGDIFSHQVKRLSLGPLVGTRTWGGVVGIFVRNFFIDGGLASQPEYAISFDTGPEVENYGVDPDILVENDINSNDDAQLEKAIELALDMVK